MTFKVEELCEEVCQVRGYRNEKDIPFIFVCTLYRANKNKKWEVRGLLTSERLRPRELLASYKFIEDFPGGTFTWVSKKDFERFYKKHCFVCIDCKRL